MAHRVKPTNIARWQHTFQQRYAITATEPTVTGSTYRHGEAIAVHTNAGPILIDIHGEVRLPEPLLTSAFATDLRCARLLRALLIMGYPLITLVDLVEGKLNKHPFASRSYEGILDQLTPLMDTYRLNFEPELCKELE